MFVTLTVYFSGVPKTFLIFGESGGTSRFYQLAEWFGLRDLVAEREVYRSSISVLRTVVFLGL